MRKDARLARTFQEVDVLTTKDLRTLAEASHMYGTFGGRTASGPGDPSVRQLALDALGGPSDDDVVGSAIALLSDDDRNLRVAALRVLWWYRDRRDVGDALLRTTHDAVRRVRRIAIDQVPPDHPGAAERLLEIVNDESEYHRIRAQATMGLGRAASLEAVQPLLSVDRWRRRVLFMLIRRPADAAARDVLREIVRVGDKDEAVVATRALCGQVIVNTGGRKPSEDAEPADVGWLASPGTLTKTKDTVFYWVRAS